jgi:hypothetical protein
MAADTSTSNATEIQTAILCSQTRITKGAKSAQMRKGKHLANRKSTCFACDAQSPMLDHHEGSIWIWKTPQNKNQHSTKIPQLRQKGLLPLPLLLDLLESLTAEMQVPNHTPDVPLLLQLRLLNDISCNQVRRISNMLNSRQNILQSNSVTPLCPAKRCRQTFIFCSNPSSQLRPTITPTTSSIGKTQGHSPKKYSTNARSAVPSSESPNAIIGAASSPRLNCSMVAVKV